MIYLIHWAATFSRMIKSAPWVFHDVTSDLEERYAINPEWVEYE